ncbi:MAG: CHRD domain-containing protein, partial [Gammaproteobacteria bacterium]|nr:CHRD domain-containing protein [Gammaproteobacteria bacterium]
LAEKVNGRLAEGYIFTASQLDSPRADVTTVEELIDAISQGRASVIIHSSDFPRGELRGTLQ